MNAAISRIRIFFADASRRRLSYLAVLLLFAAGDYAFSARSARTFVFVSLLDGGPVVERRFLPRKFKTEAALSIYIAEYLLGPATVGSSFLFSKGTRLETLMVRGGVAHVDLSSDAAFPPEPGLDVRDSLTILVSGIERNFPGLKQAKVYIEGHEPYAYEVSAGSSNETLAKNGKSVDK